MRTSMLRLALLVTPLLAPLVIGGCAQVMSPDSGPQVVNAQTANKLHQREWDLKGLTLEGQQIVMDLDARVSIRFDANGQVSGIAAVNRYTGTYVLSADGKLGWGSPGFAVTRKAGPPELMQIEQAYLKALRVINVAILARHTLVIQSDDAATVLTFSEVGF
jgi:heat shock protein HslJ